MNDARRARTASRLRVPPGRWRRCRTGSYYEHDLIGCEVVTADGREIGVVRGRGRRRRARSTWWSRPTGRRKCRSRSPGRSAWRSIRSAKRIAIDPPDGLLERERVRARRTQVKFDIVTIFPQMFAAPLAEGVVGARDGAPGVVDVTVHDLRDFTTDRHRVVDDVPFGGGPGMVLKPEPLFARGGAHPATRGDAWCDRADLAAGATVHAGARRSGLRDWATWRCSAGATRAWTSGFASTSPPRRSRLATTC